MTETKVFSNNEDRIHNNAIHVRHWSADICGYLEDFLSDHDIFIPNEEREGDEEEACLYADDYTEIEDFVTEELVGLYDKVKPCTQLNNPEIEDWIWSLTTKTVAETVCEEFDNIITLGLTALNRMSEKEKLTPCSLSEEVKKEAIDFLKCVKEYPEYDINTEDY